MKRHSFASRMTTGLALMGCLSLLLADSAEPYCGSSKGPFDRTFDYTTTCNGTHSGRIRVTAQRVGPVPVAGGWSPVSKEMITLISGELPNADIFINGTCADEDEPTVTTGITMKFPGTSDFSTSSSSSSSSSGGGAGGNAGAGGSTGLGGAPVTPDIMHAQCEVNFKTTLGQKPVACVDRGYGENGFDYITNVVCTLQLSEVK